MRVFSCRVRLFLRRVRRWSCRLFWVRAARWQPEGWSCLCAGFEALCIVLHVFTLLSSRARSVRCSKHTMYQLSGVAPFSGNLRQAMKDTFVKGLGSITSKFDAVFNRPARAGRSGAFPMSHNCVRPADSRLIAPNATLGET